MSSASGGSPVAELRSREQMPKADAEQRFRAGACGDAPAILARLCEPRPNADAVRLLGLTRLKHLQLLLAALAEGGALPAEAE
jgi:hypothetical protein